MTIGLPLATGLTLRQFAGVLAHEFGHFAQRAGMRSYYLIQTIRLWFARVVYERDSWDAWLDEKTESEDWRIRAVAWIADLAVKGSRRYLDLLMKIGGWVSSSFSRQMEYDADRYEAAIAGAAVFEETSLRMPLLLTGAQIAWQDASCDWSVGRLPDEITAQTLAAETGRWDSHPSAADRIDRVKRGDQAGVFALDGPASALFTDLAALCRRATRHHYETVLGSRKTPRKWWRRRIRRPHRTRRGSSPTPSGSGSGLGPSLPPSGCAFRRTRRANRRPCEARLSRTPPVWTKRLSTRQFSRTGSTSPPGRFTRWALR